jgi:hypothetical protein
MPEPLNVTVLVFCVNVPPVRVNEPEMFRLPALYVPAACVKLEIVRSAVCVTVPV